MVKAEERGVLSIEAKGTLETEPQGVPMVEA